LTCDFPKDPFYLYNKRYDVDINTRIENKKTLPSFGSLVEM